MKLSSGDTGGTRFEVFTFGATGLLVTRSALLMSDVGVEAFTAVVFGNTLAIFVSEETLGTSETFAFEAVST